mmetsp:Transcript_85808/g.228725  ORF Transcript_85808/g.228725 Transcript_85808/m.228725 type:complete len:233 (-) Transcript_85808:284-982(-)
MRPSPRNVADWRFLALLAILSPSVIVSSWISVTTSRRNCSDTPVRSSRVTRHPRSVRTPELSRYPNCAPRSSSARCRRTKVCARSARALAAAICVVWFSWHFWQQRTGCGKGWSSSLGRSLHSAQKTRPQQRQWCLRCAAEKTVRQLSHVLACLSAIHAMHAVPVWHLCPPLSLASDSACRQTRASRSVSQRKRKRRWEPWRTRHFGFDLSVSTVTSCTKITPLASLEFSSL